MWKCDCGGEIIEDTGGFLVCSECGLTYGKVYDVREDPIYDESTNASHHEVIRKEYTKNKDKIYSKEMCPYCGRLFYRLKRHLPYCRSSPDYSKEEKRKNNYKKNITKIIKKYKAPGIDNLKGFLIQNEIKRICGLLNINNIIGDCFHLFEKVNKNISFLKREQTIEDVAASIVYLQSRLYGKPTFLYDFEKICFSKRNILSYYVEWVEKFKFKVKPQTPKLIVNRIVNSIIDDNPKTFRDKFLLIRDSTQLAEKHYYLGNYIITCGACVYIKSKEFGFEITQKQVSDVIGYDPRTLRRSIQKISN